MSATRDKSQNIAFIYSNLYKLYKKEQSNLKPTEKKPETVGKVPPKPNERMAQIHEFPRIIKAGLGVPQTVKKEVKPAPQSLAKVREHVPTEFLAKRISSAKPAVALYKTVQDAKPSSQSETLESLKSNLKSLNNLHERLKFMLKELEDLVKE